jgi:hypothetical protein
MAMMVIMVMMMIAVTVYVVGIGSVEMHSEFWWGKLKEGDHLEELGIDRCIIYTCIRIRLKEIKRNGVYWVNLVECRDPWWTVVNAVMDIWFP